MEQDTEIETPAAPVASSKQKSSNGLKIATTVACILAVCGIGFGVYGIMQSSQKDNRISDLKNQVDESNGKIAALETKKNETNDDDSKATTVTDTSKYIYVGEWGLKFEIPSELHQVEYEIRNSRNNNGNGQWSTKAGTSSLLVFGLLDENINNDSDFQSNSHSSCTSASIVRIPKSQNTSKPAFSIGDYDFVFEGWHAACTDAHGNSKPNQTGEIIKNALTNPDNYSKI